MLRAFGGMLRRSGVFSAHTVLERCGLRLEQVVERCSASVTLERVGKEVLRFSNGRSAFATLLPPLPRFYVALALGAPLSGRMQDPRDECTALRRYERTNFDDFKKSFFLSMGRIRSRVAVSFVRKRK